MDSPSSASSAYPAQPLAASPAPPAASPFNAPPNPVMDSPSRASAGLIATLLPSVPVGPLSTNPQHVRKMTRQEAMDVITREVGNATLGMQRRIMAIEERLQTIGRDVAAMQQRVSRQGRAALPPQDVRPTDAPGGTS
jgi:hypothetical protein